MTPSDGPDSGFRSGYVAVVGPPSSGKSTLVNRLVGRPVSIVARRPQTTRHRILGILNGPDYQALFVDTPGMIEPAYKLQELMQKEIELALADADSVVLLLDASRPDELENCLRHVNRPGLLVAVNKIDLVPKPGLLPIADQLAGSGRADVHMISALNGDGVEELKAGVVASLPPGAAYFPPDMVSERPERFFAAEIVREAIFNRYGAEVPYSSTVVVEEFKERPGRKDYVRAVVYVERDSQKSILIGKDGAALKRVGQAARKKVEEFLGRPVYLELWVKVARDWKKNERFIRQNVYGGWNNP